MSQSQKEARIIEAYDLVKNNNQMPAIHAIKRKLAFAGLVKNGAEISSFIFGQNKPYIEEVARQLLLLQVSTRPFNGKLMRAFALGETLNHELPPQWRKVLADENIKLNQPASAFQFRLYIFSRFLVNIQRGLRALLDLFLDTKTQIQPGKNYVQFCDLNTNCIPKNGNDDGYTIMNWYTHWEGKAADISEMRHNVKGIPSFTYKGSEIVASAPLAGLVMDFSKKIRLVAWFAGAVLVSFFSCFSKRWINALLLNEALLAKMIESAETGTLAKEYLYSISKFVYRPLWTYSAQRKGSLVTNYSYASSFGGFKTKDGYIDIEYYFDLNTWPRLIYWTPDLVAFVESKVPPPTEVLCAPPVYFSDYPSAFPSFDGKVIAIFDVSPNEPYQNAIALPELEYRTFEIGKQFLLDIYSVFGNKGFTIAWKRKRSFASMHSRDYIEFCNQYEQLPGVTVIHPEASAFRVIEKCDYCISMPFTSTAFIAQHFKKSSVFYDSAMILYKDDRASQSIPLLSGIGELNNWKEQLLKEATL
jgi:polysaccharide biosynthesis PFTS motif protein